MKRVKICAAGLVVLLMSIVYASPCFAQTGSIQELRRANAKDVAGSWQMLYQRVDPAIKTGSLFFADFQVFQFLNNGYFKNIASTGSPEKAAVKIYLETMPQKTTYTFVADGLLVIDRSENDFDNIAISIAVLDMGRPLLPEAPLLKKGDLLLTYLDPQKKPYLHRYFRTIKLD